MPEGPLGFPRLTTLGPLVKPSTVQPFKDIPPKTYYLDDIMSVQPKTGEDTRMALDDIIEFDLELRGKFSPSDVTFEYRKERLSNVLEKNNFSLSLLEVMSLAEERGIPLKAEEVSRMELENPMLVQEIRSHMDGESSIFTDGLLSGVDKTWERVQQMPEGGGGFESKSELRDRIVNKVVEDFHRVMEINDSIRSSNEYFPPTTENIALDESVGWGTIDGAHRIVALSQIIGSDEEIFIWEWRNQKMFIEESPFY